MTLTFDQTKPAKSKLEDQLNGKLDSL